MSVKVIVRVIMGAHKEKVKMIVKCCLIVLLLKEMCARDDGHFALNHSKDIFFLFFLTEIDFLFLLHIKSSQSTRVKRLCILGQSAKNVYWI